jgi:D-alanine-D-alanine ligase-like ATP-grasp enzyme
MLKDPSLGCSKGVWRCNNKEELSRSMKLCKSEEVLIEQFIVGTDIVCCCLEGIDGDVTVWPVVEFDMDVNCYQDLTSKNALWGWPDESDCSAAPPPLPIIKRCPATKISQSICARAQEQARCIFKEMRASGALNVEFRVTEDNAHIYFIEMSVIPALTNTSVHACCAQAGGMDYPDLVECWLKGASLKSLE